MRRQGFDAAKSPSYRAVPSLSAYQLGALGLCALALIVGSANSALAGSQGDLILNEFNAVGGTFFLGNGSSDTYFGTVQGNGGNWYELVVITDHLDVRGWTLDWRNADPDSGSVIFQDNPIWSDLRSGTIITIREDDLAPPGHGVILTDLSYDPMNGDWWIHVNVDDITVVNQFGFKVDNDNWQMRIVDESLTIIQDWTGESTALWGGTGGVGRDEVGKLEQDPSSAAAFQPPAPAYNDGKTSTFGEENQWMGGAFTQDFCALRDPVLGNPVCAAIPPEVPAISVQGGLLLSGLLAAVGCALGRRRR